MEPKKESSAASGSLVLLLFGVAFTAAGLGVGWFALRAVRDHDAMKSWKETPATITKAELESHHGDKSTTYQVKAEYTYSFGGKTYTGTRVGVHTGADNIGSWQHDTHQLLEEHRQSGKPIPCYVDPNRPDRSVLFRDLRPGIMALLLVLPAIFVGVGGSIMGTGLVIFLKSRQTARLRRRFADEPWQWRSDWGLGYCRQQGGGSPWGIALIALIWNVAAWGVVVPLMLRGMRKTPLLGLLGLIPLVGLGLAAWAAYRLAVRRKYGRPVLRLSSVPVQRGGLLRADLPLGGAVRRADNVSVTLQCVRRTVDRQGKNTTISEDTLWEKTEAAPCESGRVEFAIPIPVDQPETDPPSTNEGISWRLRIHADVPGVDYRGTFEIPVFGVADDAAPTHVSSAEAGSADGETTTEVPETELEADDIVKNLQEAGLRIQRHPQGGIRIVAPPFRFKKAAAMLSVFLLFWVAVTLLLFHFPKVPLLFKIIWPLTDLFILWGLLYMIFWSSVTEVRQGRLRIRYGLMGSRFREVATAEITDIVLAFSMQSGAQRFYSVKLITPQGKLTAVRLIKGKARAEQLRQLLQDAVQGDFG